MTKISNLYSLTNYITASTSGNIVISAPSSGYALDVTGTGRFTSTATLDGGSIFSASASLISTDSSLGRFTNNYLYLQGVAAGGLWLASSSSRSNSIALRSTTNEITFDTNGTQRMVITSGGYVKASNNGVVYSNVGTFHEMKNTIEDATLRLINTNGSPYGLSVYFTGADPNNASNYLFNAQSTFTGTTLYSIWSNGTVSGRSDARLKKNIVDSTPKLDKLMQLRIVNYEWKESLGGTKELGLIAQEVEEVFPNLVITEPVIKEREVVLEDGTIEIEKYEDGDSKSLKNSVLPYITIKALQELTNQVQELSTKVTALENK